MGPAQTSNDGGCFWYLLLLIIAFVGYGLNSDAKKTKAELEDVRRELQELRRELKAR